MRRTKDDIIDYIIMIVPIAGAVALFAAFVTHIFGL